MKNLPWQLEPHCWWRPLGGGRAVALPTELAAKWFAEETFTVFLGTWAEAKEIQPRESAQVGGAALHGKAHPHVGKPVASLGVQTSDAAKEPTLFDVGAA